MTFIFFNIVLFMFFFWFFLSVFFYYMLFIVAFILIHFKSSDIPETSAHGAFAALNLQVVQFRRQRNTHFPSYVQANIKFL